jgi:hypothetical protein
MNMGKESRRIKREKKTIDSMIRLYCRNQHRHGKTLCADCRGLLDYSMKRLDRCQFQEKKTTCANCNVHCYKPSMREQVKKVMRYSGPRMIYFHPVLALLHFIDGFQKESK